MNEVLKLLRLSHEMQKANIVTGGKKDQEPCPESSSSVRSDFPFDFKGPVDVSILKKPFQGFGRLRLGKSLAVSGNLSVLVMGLRDS
ncbi:hypothetical protein NL676_029103 [Syzygium grande]|nr:hypothetical protein NL676_029103 [Syzygium grande]